MKRLYAQLIHLRQKRVTTGAKTRQIRRIFARTSFLLNEIQIKKLFYSGQFKKSLHLLGEEAQNLHFSPAEWEFLSKGASFVPSTPVQLPLAIDQAFEEFSNRILWKHYWANRVQLETNDFVLKKMDQFCIQHRSSKGITSFPEHWKRRHGSVMRYLEATKPILSARVNLMQNRKFRSNVATNLHRFWTSLRDHPECILKKTDKNMGLALVARSLYLQKCHQTLEAMNLVRLSPAQIRFSFEVCQRDLRSFKGYLSKQLWKRIQPYLELPLSDQWSQFVPVLYGLPKVHKPTLKMRPIVAASQLPFKDIAGYVGFRINEILQRSSRITKFLVKDSRSVVSYWQGRRLSPKQTHFWGITFDVVELYPSLPTDDATLQKMKQFFITEPGVPDAWILLELLDFLLRFNWFQFEGNFFQQVSGLAMGYPHSPPVANLLMWILFEQFLDMGDIVLYHRYLDDGVVIFDSTRERVCDLLTAWNQMVPGISFTWDIFDMEQERTPLSFLDLQFGISGQELIFQTHQKKLNSYLYIPSDSMHPDAVKASLVKTELIRHTRCCSTLEAFQQMKTLFWHRLRLRGYSVLWLRKQFNTVRYEDRVQFLQPRHHRESILIFKIKYSFAVAALNLSFILNQFFTDDLKEQLCLQSEARIIICYQRHFNLGNLIIRARDCRPPLGCAHGQSINQGSLRLP